MINLSIRRNIVLGYKKQRSVFDKTNYVDYWIPRPNKYNIKRKPRLAQWDDPNIVWPPVCLPTTNLKGKGLIKVLEKEEHERMKLLKPFEYPEFKTGDVVSFRYLHSMSEGMGNEYQGTLIGSKKIKSLHGTVNILSRAAGVPFYAKLKMNSPLLSSFNIISKGSGNLRSKLYYLWQRANHKSKFLTPIIKKHSKPRTNKVSGKSQKKGNKLIEVNIEDPILK